MTLPPLITLKYYSDNNETWGLYGTLKPLSFMVQEIVYKYETYRDKLLFFHKKVNRKKSQVSLRKIRKFGGVCFNTLLILFRLETGHKVLFPTSLNIQFFEDQ